MTEVARFKNAGPLNIVRKYHSRFIVQLWKPHVTVQRFIIITAELQLNYTSWHNSACLETSTVLTDWPTSSEKIDIRISNCLNVLVSFVNQCSGYVLLYSCYDNSVFSCTSNIAQKLILPHLLRYTFTCFSIWPVSNDDYPFFSTWYLYTSLLPKQHLSVQLISFCTASIS